MDQSFTGNSLLKSQQHPSFFFLVWSVYLLPQSHFEIASSRNPKKVTNE
jgi:hypothetical protein